MPTASAPRGGLPTHAELSQDNFAFYKAFTFDTMTHAFHQHQRPFSTSHEHHRPFPFQTR